MLDDTKHWDTSSTADGRRGDSAALEAHLAFAEEVTHTTTQSLHLAGARSLERDSVKADESDRRPLLLSDGHSRDKSCDDTIGVGLQEHERILRLSRCLPVMKSFVAEALL